MDNLKTSLPKVDEALLKQAILKEIVERYSLDKPSATATSAPTPTPTQTQLPAVPQLSPDQIVREEKETILGWIRDVIKATDFTALVKFPPPPDPAEVVTGARDTIMKWIAEKVTAEGKAIEGRVDTAVDNLQKADARLKDEQKILSDALEKLKKQPHILSDKDIG